MKNIFIVAVLVISFSGCMFASETYVAENESYKYKGSYVGYKWDGVEERAKDHCAEGHTVVSKSNDGRLIGTQTNIKIVPKHINIECE